MKLRCFCLCVWLLAFLWGCASSPSSEPSSPSSEEPTKNTVRKSSLEKKESGFDYQKYIDEKGIAEKWRAQKRREREEKERYNTILQSMAGEIQQEWREREKKAEQLFPRAYRAYGELDWKRAYELLRKVLALSPDHPKGKELFERLLFWRNEKALLWQQVLLLIRKERREFGAFRIKYLRALQAKVRELEKRGKHQEAKRLRKELQTKYNLALHWHLLSTSFSQNLAPQKK